MSKRVRGSSTHKEKGRAKAVYQALKKYKALTKTQNSATYGQLFNWTGTSSDHICKTIDVGDTFESRDGNQVTLTGMRISGVICNKPTYTGDSTTTNANGALYVRIMIIQKRTASEFDNVNFWEAYPGSASWGATDTAVDMLYRPTGNQCKILWSRKFKIGGNTTSGIGWISKDFDYYINFRGMKFTWNDQTDGTNDIQPHLRLVYAGFPDGAVQTAGTYSLQFRRTLYFLG